MILPDVNVLVYAPREDAVDHARYRQWLEEIIQSGQPYGLSDHVLSGFLRVVTHPRVFTTPSSISSALEGRFFIALHSTLESSEAGWVNRPCHA